MPADPPVPDPVVPRPAAAAIVLRDGADGLEVLLAQRSAGSSFLPGFWVFPGGRVEPEDDDGGPGRWRAAAAREVLEEVGLELDARTLAPFDRWITPEGLPQRFDTAFFVAPATGAEAVADAHEVVATRWEAPARVIDAADTGMPVLAFPTQRQLERLAGYATVAEALASCGPELPPATMTTFRVVDGAPAMEVEGPDGTPRPYRGGPVGPVRPPAGAPGDVDDPAA
jgi:8-oxo-dGTP pyrophosphatase MutT (NUDIX family)